MLRHRLIAALLVLVAAIRPAAANDLEAALREGYAMGELPGLHAVLVIREGETLAEVYFNDTDEVWGQPIGIRAHGPQTLHDLRSISKSVVGLLYGIALGDGLVPAPNAPLLKQFPEYADLATPERDAITIADVLTMRTGLHWDETLPYTDARNSEIAMERAPDRIRFILEQDVVSPAGKSFTYSGGTTALLAELIARGAGQPVDVFARERLFRPLGIHRYEWVRGADGRPSAASGLRLSARGLARIGQMMLDNGRVEGRQIIPADWIKATLTPHVDVPPLRFGYHWWLSPNGAPDWAAGLGNGGQRISVNAALDLVAVIYAGNYNQPTAWEVPVSVLNKYVAPALGLD